MTKPSWLNIHTPLETIPNDDVAVIRTSLVHICGGYCAAMILNDFYFQTYCGTEGATDIIDLTIMMTNMFSTEEILEALEAIASKGYAKIEIREDHYIAYELFLDVIHKDLGITTSFDTQHAQELEAIEPPEALMRTKHQRSERNESKVVRFHNKRASTIALPATLTFEQWKQTLKDFDNKCAYCPDGDYEVLEHFIPLIFGGGTTEYNCVPACNSCNSIKSDQHPTMMPENCKIAKGLLSVQRYLKSK